MTDENHGFAERLLASEKMSPVLRKKYEEEVRALFEKPVKGFRKLGWILSTVMGFGFFLLFGGLAVFAPTEFSLLGRVGFAAGALFGFAFAILGIVTLKKGAEDLRTHGKTSVELGWGVTVALSTIAIVLGPQLPGNAGLMMIAIALVFLVPAATFKILWHIESAELRTREKLLEIECRLAELAGKSNHQA